MDSPAESKPIIETKSTEESSNNLIISVLSAFIENDEFSGISSGDEKLESHELENKDGGNFKVESDTLEHCDSEREEKQNKMDVTKKPKSDNKNDFDTKSFENYVEEKELLKMENNIQQQINYQYDVSGDGSNTSTSSSGIEVDIGLHEDCVGVIIKKEVELVDNIFEDSSANQFCNAECSNFVKDSSSKIKDEDSETLGFKGKEQDKLNLINSEDNILKGKGRVPACNSALLFDSIKFPYKDPSNAFEVVVPLIGKNIMVVPDIKPSNQGYELAREINRLKGLEDAPFMPKLSYHEWRKQRDARSQEEKDREEKKEKFVAGTTAMDILEISIHILQEMQKNNPDEKRIEKWFFRFLQLPVSSLSLLLSSEFVHTMMYIRGSPEFSQRLRYVADNCYMKCHVMFPIFEGYNFETVYTSEVIKNIPPQLNGTRNFVLDYGEFEYPVSESDSAFSDSEDSEEM